MEEGKFKAGWYSVIPAHLGWYLAVVDFGDEGKPEIKYQTPIVAWQVAADYLGAKPIVPFNLIEDVDAFDNDGHWRNEDQAWVMIDPSRRIYHAESDWDDVHEGLQWLKAVWLKKKAKISMTILHRLHTLHRRLFGRCQGCNCRLGRYRPVVLGHEPGRLFRRELGLWHEECLDGELDCVDNAIWWIGEQRTVATPDNSLTLMTYNPAAVAHNETE